ncbi:acetate/propionate family kinase [Mycetocola reblochoni]|uniref:Acetate kinase n=2 Tax=Mycetocola reblochoni TaxID=331618 RepID=A0A1R4J1X9_9MICO|nr:acetate kinase [Mycetocola reblochoni]RLP70575.1 acetate kinase [Mycetocola reblochoni]SJN25683.1 Acetate kinase [Mycetocola reblochoni REB411]
MSVVLVVNSGSSSFKYQLIDVETEQVHASGLIERIGQDMGAVVHSNADGKIVRELPITDHTHGFTVMQEAFATLGPSLELFPPVAVGHRVVHGGKRFFEPTLVTELVKINIADIAELAPLHNPAHLQGISAAELAFPSIPHVVVFDTAFHRTLPEAAWRYAIDRELADRHRLRRYGFHGTSHKFVSEATAAFLGRPLAELNQIVLHLGNGASACAIRGGESVETSMGLTPLEGLVMGTRSGDLDPAVLFQLHRKTHMTVPELDDLLNRRSGILGLSGDGDMRELIAHAEEGVPAAVSALDVYVHRLRAYIGAYYAQLGLVDTIVFTAGVGENTPLVRERALAGLDRLGIVLDPERNASPERGARVISADDSEVTVLVVPTNEELEIARQTLSIVDPGATTAGG